MVSISKKVRWEKFKEEFLDVVFPRFCVGCKKEGVYICNRCSRFLSENSLICPICGDPSYTGLSCFSCVGRYGLDGLVSGWDYEGIIKKAVWQIKAGHYHMAEKIAERFFFMIISQEDRFRDFLKFLFQEEVFITYVPERVKSENIFKKIDFFIKNGGVNNYEKKHAEVLARTISEISEKEVVNSLKKIKKTRKQSRLSKEERLDNLKGAFQAKGAVPNNLVLVDDVFTTGATLRECAKTLKKAGAKKVWGLTLTRST